MGALPVVLEDLRDAPVAERHAQAQVVLVAAAVMQLGGHVLLDERDVRIGGLVEADVVDADRGGEHPETREQVAQGAVTLDDGRRTDQPGDRQPPLPQREDDRDPPHARIPEARSAVARAGRGRRGSSRMTYYEPSRSQRLPAISRKTATRP